MTAIIIIIIVIIIIIKPPHGQPHTVLGGFIYISGV